VTNATTRVSTHAAAALFFAGCLLSSTAGAESLGAVDDTRLAVAHREPGSWLAHGRTWAEQRYSPLALINEHNVDTLGLAWSFATGTRRGLEATPLMVDGVLYTTGSWSLVYALDARTGELLWRYDPEVPRQTGYNACCDTVNRGVAVYRGRVFVGTLDGRLVALDAATGSVVWEARTTDPKLPYTITGAPRVLKGKVLIGNGGGEYGVRGYVSAYTAETGELVWRFYTVPGDPSRPFEHEGLARAAETWSGEWWKLGGGGTVWDSMAYDPGLDLLYVGTGNGSPWNRTVRSPGGGDNLFISSILALRPETGELVWYYQTTPGDRFDYTATQHMILADLEIRGARRKVLMQAPKNGFFYVLDRATGELISAAPFVRTTWAERIDLETGRPVIPDGVDPKDRGVEIWPSTKGGHNWQPMAFHPRTGFVYIPTTENASFYKEDPAYVFDPGGLNLGYDFFISAPKRKVSGRLTAWDPIAQREAWRVEQRVGWNGGVLATAGNLVFQGTGDKTFAAYRASDGRKLWETPTTSGVIAAPITYRLDGEQYVAVMAGWGGGFGLNMGAWAALAGNRYGTEGRLLVYRLGGRAPLPPEPPPEPPVTPIPGRPDPARVAEGHRSYHLHCFVCHGAGAIGGGVVADLRKSTPGVYDALRAIVLEGAFLGRGMPSFAGRLTERDVDAIRAYLLSRRAALLGGE
jgi:PQQ-dependent dehydrogenase (methanol/ethanol family)